MTIPLHPRLALLAATLHTLPLLALPTPFLLLLVTVLEHRVLPALLLIVLMTLVAGWQMFLAWRLALDARLFALLAEGLAPAELDDWLSMWLRRPRDATHEKSRSEEERVQGTLRLMRRYRWLTLMVWGLVLLALVRAVSASRMLPAV